MKFQIAQIVLPLELSEYTEAYLGKRLMVWVNPPREVKEERESILRDYSRALKHVLTPETILRASPLKKGRDFLSRLFGTPTPDVKSRLDAVNERMFAWLVKIWNQHEDEDCAWPVEDIRALYEADPAMYQWVVQRTVQMISDFRGESKKK
jgi:hypothetical protein